ncbi:Clan S-, family S54, Rhomboid-like serine peptidase [Trichomonas vaginalis G3]|uniref:rhomboid protease n=1 Tax=Trichomonas vaginalis (strain ATCC PRA-98 / G3) TaxID=412133 RepID=A2DB87_TRIV3|nr:serine-type endopeptidase protein [Trichomonas vaginalis G3]EAY22417.1 Clan S-, family S54, Rhomboid-like serine peptidase [Trichomonas vaginalis G3]KAI5517636.1 serine-type endopeptidase protein [Trichomonas vaginalis G3]|eukprot:XP_001583403.1 Clan S-, family S54, Rhomboid-like serine peptidase [Trichomonas vaginalis G3]
MSDKSSSSGSYYSSDSPDSSRHESKRSKAKSRFKSNWRSSDSDQSSTYLSDISSDSKQQTKTTKIKHSDQEESSKSSKKGGYFEDNDDMLDSVQDGANWWQAQNSLMTKINQPLNNKPRVHNPDKDTELMTGMYEPMEIRPKNSESGNDFANNDAVVDFDPTSLKHVKNYNESAQDYLLIDLKSPLIWTIGFMVLAAIHLGFAFYFWYKEGDKGFANFKSYNIQENLYYGPSAKLLMRVGALYPPWIYDGEWWRLLVAISLQPGVAILAIDIVYMGLLYEIERYNGFWSALLIFLLCGLYGNVLSSYIISESVICGATGAICGWLGFSLTRLIASFHIKKRVCYLITEIFMIIFIGAVGILPYVDNFQHVGGFVLGVLLSLALLPNNTKTKCAAIARGITAFLAFPIMIIVFSVVVTFVIKNNLLDGKCKFCPKIQCQNLIKNKPWCLTNIPSLQDVYPPNISDINKSAVPEE